MLQREHSGDGCDLTFTLCTYHLRNDHVFAPSWAICLNVVAILLNVMGV